jgi:hypothetical protein
MILSWNKNSMRQPIGGHHYPVDKPMATVLRAKTLDDLVEELHDFRVNNGITLGNPLQDILEYYRHKWPYLVVEEPGDPEDVSIRYAVWRSWIQRTWAHPPKNLVPAKTAQERWAICEKCPYNKQRNWTRNDESKELTKRAFLLRRGVDVPDFLGYCAYHGVDLGAFTMFDKPEAHVQSEGKYEGCFLEKIKNHE